MPRPTKTGLLLLPLMLMLYVSSMQSESGLLFLIIGVVVGCFLVCAMGAMRSVSSLRLRNIPSLRATEGTPPSVSIEVDNTGKRPIGMLEVGTVHGTLFRIESLPPKSANHVTPELTIPTRGVYPFDKLRVRSTFPFGLVAAQKTRRMPGELIVYPYVYPCSCPKAAGFEPMVGGMYTGKHRSITGSDFAGVRPYQPQDSMKSIHWKSSSKGVGIMVKEFNEELSGRIAFVIDCSAATTRNGEKGLDWVCRAAASLMFAALDHDHHVEIVDTGSLQVIHNPAFLDGDAILEFLARLNEETTPLDSAKLRTATDQLSRKAAICLVVSRISAEIEGEIERLRQENRVVTLCFPCTEPAPEFNDPGLVLLHFSHQEIGPVGTVTEAAEDNTA